MATRYDPFREMERLLNASVRQAPSSLAMPLDLYREGDAFIAQIDLPGVDPASIDIDVEDRTLTIRAERRSVSGEDLEWLTRERPTGTFARQIGLGLGVASDKIEATYADGVLTLTIPVAEEAKPRKIQVNHATAPQTIEHDVD
ncbi:heat-shock protein Hsp20 [Bowdeniella nasicola]|uniref:Heat-shock protein Hsp20 n=1 Tax=Bowdeniella nasicola TaxID=208480 RepID=A0A1Q5Q0P1_9ACTO|nr:Hsp20/alpha crystallin family protein [Bowdeniella nasicola]OKL53262.1 heat-shock protein Hsp20 [Bowdeniella nasicola]